MSKRRFYFKPLVAVFAVLYSSNVFAISPEQLQQQQLILQQQQEQRRQEEMNRQQIRQVEKIRKSIENPDEVEGDYNKKKDIVKTKDTDDCVRFEKVDIIGNKKLSTKYLFKKAVKKYMGQCVNKNNISDIQNTITNIYFAKGYITTRVYFNFDKLNSGVFEIFIDEGKIKNIVIKDKNDEGKKISKFKAARLNMQKFFAFPFQKGKVFNLRTFEQGLDQMNRLRSNNAVLDIKPTDDVDDFGYSDIYILNNEGFGTNINFAVDNSGSRSTGERLGNVSLSQDNLFSINDNIYLKYTQDLDSENNLRYNKAFYGNFSFPFGNWTFSGSANYSKYLTTVNGYYTTFHTSGNTLTQNYSIDKVLYGNRTFKSNFGTQLEIKDTNSYIRNLRSQTGSRKSSNIGFYLNNIIYTKLGTIIIRPTYQIGTDWFNSKKDPDDILRGEPHLQYDLLKLYVYYNTRINLPLFTKTQVVDNNGNIVLADVKTKDKDGKETVKKEPMKVRNKIPLNYTLSLDSQYSFDTLYGTDQFSVGGEYTVRGFRNGNISGDIGYYVRNDLSVGLVNLFPNMLVYSKAMNFGSKYRLSVNDFLSKTTVSAFFDYGYVRNKNKIVPDNYNANSGYLSGAGVALNYHGRYLNWSLTYAKALHSPQYLQSRDGIKKENHNLYWRASTYF